MNNSSFPEMSAQGVATVSAYELGLIFNRPVYDMQEVLSCSQEESMIDSSVWPRLVFLQVDTVAFRDRRDIRKSLSQFYGVLHAMNTRFWYVIKGSRSEGNIKLYLGIIPDFKTSVKDFTQSLLGIMPGCQVSRGLSNEENQQLVRELSNYSAYCFVTGVPTCHTSWEKRDQYQEEEKARTGIERIIDSLVGEDFALSILSEPLELDEMREYRSGVAELHNIVKPLAQYHTNISESSGAGRSLSVNLAISQGANLSSTHGENTSTASSAGESSSSGTGKTVKDGNLVKRFCKTLTSWVKGGEQAVYSVNVQSSSNSSTTVTEGSSKQTTQSLSSNVSRGNTKTININETQTVGINREVSNMELSALSEQLGKLHKRLVNAEGQGMWKTCVIFHANQQTTLQRAAYAGVSIWSGDESAYDPMRCMHIKKERAYYRDQFQLLSMKFTSGSDNDDLPIHPLGAPYSNLYTCLTHNELAHIADFPHWDIPGITVQPLVEYARCSPKPKDGVPTINLGGLIDRTVNRKSDVGDMISMVRLGYDQLNKHCFVCGVTGSGKSTTMRSLLHEIAAQDDDKPQVNFMVLEPVKTEYRALENEKSINLVRFSLGRKGGRDFALNPFSFPEGVELFSHLDFLKASFNALLGSYSSMPFIIEELLCEAYKEKGWNLETGENRRMLRHLATNMRPSERWKIREMYMPLIGDMADKVDSVLTDFFGEDKSDYRISLKGALRARLKSLCSSLKGQLLNRPEILSFEELLHQNVLFELEAFSDNDEKSFIMALLLGRIYEYRQVEYQRGLVPDNQLRHILVLEEAHRLLAKSESRGEHQANPRNKSVEIFSDMLAEVRAYGQGMIIVDQIPSKLTPEVMKNTEVKIAHRLLSKDDREAVGATMNLTKEQIEDLARHDAGEATMYFGNLANALHVKIKQK